MTAIKIIQIGDIHYPDAKNARVVDHKDEGLSSAQMAPLAVHSLEAVGRTVANLSKDDKDIVGILLCGDLTSCGDAEGYKDCLKYLDRILQIGNTGRWPDSGIHAVVGNHDVVRSATEPGKPFSTAKFKPFEDAWGRVRNGVLVVDRHRQAEIKSDGCLVSVFSLNSCLGCGEWRALLLPKDAPDNLGESLDVFLDTTSADGTPADRYERLDTPAFREEDVAAVVHAIETAPSDAVPLVLAHHNVLPQERLRVATYTEVMNAGMVRCQLARCRRPVIYCHGHIHADPIEILTHPESVAGHLGCLIAISAPEFTTGFNVLEIHFGRLNRPVGIVVREYRTVASGSISERRHAHRVPLYTPAVAMDENLVDEFTETVIRALDPNPLKSTRLPALHAQLRATGRREKKRTLADAYLDAEWLGLVTIKAREKAPELWQISRISP